MRVSTLANGTLRMTAVHTIQRTAGTGGMEGWRVWSMDSTEVHTVAET